MASIAKLEIAPRATPLRVVESVDDYAYVLAHVRHFGDESSVLAALGVEAGDWADAQQWGARMAVASLRGDQKEVAAFTCAFRAELERLRVARDPAEPADATPIEESAPARVRGAPADLSARGASDAAAAQPLFSMEGEASGSAPLRAPEPAGATRAPMETRELAFMGPRQILPFDPNARPTLPDRTDPEPQPPSSGVEDPLERTLSIEVLRPPDLVLPFVPTPTMSVEQYASMRASLEVFPDKRAVILARYGIGDEAHLKTVGEAFSTVFTDDPATYEAFLRRFEEVRARLEGSPR